MIQPLSTQIASSGLDIASFGQIEIETGEAITDFY